MVRNKHDMDRQSLRPRGESRLGPHSLQPEASLSPAPQPPSSVCLVPGSKCSQIIYRAPKKNNSIIIVGKVQIAFTRC